MIASLVAVGAGALLLLVTYLLYLYQTGQSLEVEIYLLKHRLSRWGTRLQMAIAWRVPRWLAYWCYVRVFSHGTTGKHGSTEVGEVRAMTILKRWEDKK